MLHSTFIYLFATCFISKQELIQSCTQGRFLFIIYVNFLLIKKMKSNIIFNQQLIWACKHAVKESVKQQKQLQIHPPGSSQVWFELPAVTYCLFYPQSFPITGSVFELEMDRQGSAEKQTETNRTTSTPTPSSAAITMATVSSCSTTCTQAPSTSLSIISPDRQAVQVLDSFDPGIVSWEESRL